MLFTSLTFFLFLAAIVLLVRLLPWSLGRPFLVATSYVFYGVFEPWYCLLLLASTLVDFIAAQRIHATSVQSVRRRWLFASLALNLGLLGLFKYADFGIANLNHLLDWAGLAPLPFTHWLLPIGISFYTFQTLSYTIDVYRGRQQPTRDFTAFALYVAFFPQLVAGPIERAHRLLPQFAARKRPVVTENDLAEGFQRILWGLMKKTVFADRLALMVDQVYAAPGAHSAPELIVATLCFSFQLYLDFSAYTDIAIGTARCLGIRLSENFNYPFLARTPSDFWSRWHMTLTAWFRDYVYQSLGGTRRGAPLRTAMAILVSMSLVGLWHGADWNFVMFGFLSGLAVVVHQLLRLRLGRGPLLGRHAWSPLLAILLMNVTINVIMVFFRAPDLGTAFTVLAGMVTQEWRWSGRYDVAALLLLVAISAHAWRGLGLRAMQGLLSYPPLRGACWLGILLLIVYGAVDRSERFIYFQF